MQQAKKEKQTNRHKVLAKSKKAKNSFPRVKLLKATPLPQTSP